MEVTEPLFQVVQLKVISFESLLIKNKTNLRTYSRLRQVLPHLLEPLVRAFPFSLQATEVTEKRLKVWMKI